MANVYDGTDIDMAEVDKELHLDADEWIKEMLK